MVRKLFGIWWGVPYWQLYLGIHFLRLLSFVILCDRAKGKMQARKVEDGEMGGKLGFHQIPNQEMLDIKKRTRRKLREGSQKHFH